MTTNIRRCHTSSKAISTQHRRVYQLSSLTRSFNGARWWRYSTRLRRASSGPLPLAIRFRWPICTSQCGSLGSLIQPFDLSRRWRATRWLHWNSVSSIPSSLRHPSAPTPPNLPLVSRCVQSITFHLLPSSSKALIDLTSIPSASLSHLLDARILGDAQGPTCLC